MPESVIIPSSRQRAKDATTVNDPQRVCRTEFNAVIGTHVPPMGGGVDRWIAADGGLVCLREIADPVNDKSGVQAIAIVIICVVYGAKY